MPKHQYETKPPPECPRDPLGLAPAVLAKRDIFKPTWCPKVDIEFDPWCNAENPKCIIPKDIYKAAAVIRQEIPQTPLVRSKCCVQLGSEIYYKFESLNHTGSFHEKGALYSLQNLTNDQKREGVYTASTGNWAKALANIARRFKVPVTVVLPEYTSIDVAKKIQEYGATVILHGKDFAEAKNRAFVLMHENGTGIYINGYDHPHVIAAAGVIGLEILEQLPQTDVVLVPVGGGGLIAGITAIVKHCRPEIQIYGLEPNSCCCFFKAIDNEKPYTIASSKGVAGSLAVSTAGYNAFHTACSLIDKMVLVGDDCITRAILHLAEEEKVVIEGAGAICLGPFLSRPHLLPELRHKTVVCIMTGSNMDYYAFPLTIERAKALQGRQIRVNVTLESMEMRVKILSIISNLGVTVFDSITNNSDISQEFLKTTLTLDCETSDIEHACRLKRVLTRLFPDQCEFLEEPFSPIPICICRPGATL